MSKPFKIFECCIPTKGFKRSIIADIQRNTFYLVPNALYSILKNYDGCTIEYVKEQLQNKEDFETIDEYFNFLEEEEIIFFSDRIENFPKLTLQWEEPSFITNAIIDVSSKRNHNYGLIFKQLSNLKCKNLQIRFFENIDLETLDKILSELERTRIVNIELLTKFNSEFNELVLERFCIKHKQISIWTLYSATKNQYLHFQPNSFGNIFLIEQNIDSNLHCGITSLDYFTINIKTFTEAQLHNTCLNRKIAIDVDGNIKNCPSMPHSYGNIKDTTLREALEHPDFKKYWYIHKDQIEVCKDCEFRYICTDCRAYLEDPDNLYSKPLKCGYNPYTCEWEEWSTNPLKQKAIEYYGMQELVKQEPEEPRERATK